MSDVTNLTVEMLIPIYLSNFGFIWNVHKFNSELALMYRFDIKQNKNKGMKKLYYKSARKMSRISSS